MRMSLFSAIGSTAAVLLLAPGMSMAAMPLGCATAAPTVQSQSWDFSREATNLLSDLHAIAGEVDRKANEVSNFVPMEYDWRDYSAQYTTIRQYIDQMGQKICRLESIRSAVPAWQQEAIDQAAKKVELMATNAEDAIQYLNTYEGRLWRPEFRKFETILHSEAHDMGHLTSQYVTLAKSHNREKRLEGSLGVTTAS